MGKFKHKFLFVVLTSSAFISPFLMVVALWTNYWLHSTERTVIPKDAEILTSTMSTVTIANILKLSTDSFLAIEKKILSTTTTQKPTTTYNTFFPPTYKVYANYGLWESCKITEQTKLECEFIKYFQASDSENHLTDSIKNEIGRCLIIFLISCLLMVISVLIHTYALIKRRVQYLFLVSGCFFIFAGLFSLTGLIIFIAAVNGAVDSKLTLNNSKEEEPFFQYSYGLSFFSAVSSFLFQELNGICNIYWYMGHYRKHKLDKYLVQAQEKTTDSKLKYDKESAKRKPSLAKISRTLMGDSSELDKEKMNGVSKIQISEVKDPKSINNINNKSLGFLKSGTINYKINKPEKHYITTFKSKAHLIKNLNRLNFEEKANTKSAAINMKQDDLVLKDLKINGEGLSSVVKKKTDSESEISSRSSVSSSSPISTPSSPSYDSADPSLLDSIDETRHAKHHMCHHKIKILKKQMIQHNIGQKVNQLKQASMDVDNDIRSKFYKLDLDNETNSYTSAAFRPNHSDYPIDSSCKHHYQHCCVNNPTIFAHTTYSNPIKLSQQMHQCHSKPPFIHKLSPSISQSNLVKNKPIEINNFCNSMAATNQHCHLHEPTLSFKDICSKQIKRTDYASVYPTNSQEINYEQQHPRVNHQNYALIPPASYPYNLKNKNAYYNNSIRDLTKNLPSPIKTAKINNPTNNKLPPYEALQHLTSYHSGADKYPRVIPIIKQQPVSLSIATENASQATDDYMIYRNLYRGNYTIQMPNDTHAYQLSNTVPNLCSDTSYQASTNYKDVVRKKSNHKLHRINRRIDYERVARSNKEIDVNRDEYDFDPNEEGVNKRFDSDDVEEDEVGIQSSQRQSRAMGAQKHFKRTTSV